VKTGLPEFHPKRFLSSVQLQSLDTTAKYGHEAAYFAPPHDKLVTLLAHSLSGREISRILFYGSVSNACGLIYAHHKLKEAIPVRTVAEGRRLTVHNVRRGKGTEARVPLFYLLRV
jgi:hypothetical protein